MVSWPYTVILLWKTCKSTSIEKSIHNFPNILKQVHHFLWEEYDKIWRNLVKIPYDNFVDIPVYLKTPLHIFATFYATHYRNPNFACFGFLLLTNRFSKFGRLTSKSPSVTQNKIIPKHDLRRAKLRRQYSAKL